MCTISRSTCWVITDGLEDVVPEGAAVYGLTRAKGDAMVGSDPHCALMSQAEALEIHSANDRSNSIGVQRQQVNSGGAAGTLYSRGNTCCSSSHVFLGIQEQIFYKVKTQNLFGFFCLATQGILSVETT